MDYSGLRQLISAQWQCHSAIFRFIMGISLVRPVRAGQAGQAGVLRPVIKADIYQSPAPAAGA